MGKSRYRVGAAAAEAGVGVQTLHYYERRGLIDTPRRTHAGYRVYDLATVRRVRAIKRAQALGFTLEEIAELIAIATDPREVGEVRELTERKLGAIDAKIEDLRRVRGALLETLEACRCGGDLTKCDALLALAPTHPERAEATR